MRKSFEQWRISVAIIWSDLWTWEFSHCKTKEQGSISPTFYKQLFCTNSVMHSLSVLTVWVWNFFGKSKLTQKLLVKFWWNWLQGPILPTFYEQLFGTKSIMCSLSVLKVWVSNFFLGERKLAKKLLVKCWWNWLQGSISPTCVWVTFLGTNSLLLNFYFTNHFCAQIAPYDLPNL